MSELIDITAETGERMLAVLDRVEGGDPPHVATAGFKGSTGRRGTGRGGAVVRVTSPAAGAGVYNVEVGVPQRDVTPGEVPTFTPSEETAYLKNDTEDSGHMIVDGQVLGAADCGERSSDGKRYLRVAWPEVLDSACNPGGT